MENEQLVRHRAVPLSGAKHYQEGIGRAAEALKTQSELINLSVVCLNEGREWAVLLSDGAIIGTFSRYTAVGKSLEAGAEIRSASLSSVIPFQDVPTPRVRITTTAPPGPAASATTSASVDADDGFSVPLAGAQFHQSVICRANVGDEVDIAAEPDNPHDPRALAVLLPGRGLLGYVPRESWLHRALLDEKKRYSAHIKAIASNIHGTWYVTLAITLSGRRLGIRTYQKTATELIKERKRDDAFGYVLASIALLIISIIGVILRPGK